MSADNRNSKENRTRYRVPDGWDLVRWEDIQTGDTVRTIARSTLASHWMGTERGQRPIEGVVSRVETTGPTIVFGEYRCNPTIDPMSWLRRAG